MRDIAELITEDFSGAISVIVKNSIIFQNAFGYADLANERNNTIDTKFATASAFVYQ